ncbi:MAG TPA: phosphotransferase, partial [Armatimonadota bacterium]
GSGLAISFAGYLLLGGVLHQEGIPLLIPLLMLAALAGFLYYNRPPARIIMGDTGALGLGAALGALALISRTEWLLLLFAAPFVIDTVSVVIQVSVIKFFRGPVKLLRHQTTEIFRPFLCTPLHHHFQWLTWGPWPILALFSSVGVVSVALALLAVQAEWGLVGFGWFWLLGLLLQVGFLGFAALQKVVRANYFLGLERLDGERERFLALYKGLPVEFLGVRWYAVEEVTDISESMIDTIAAESILWRSISEIEARATLGKIYAEYKLFDRAAEEWEEIPLRNLLIRETLVVQLGKIYFGRDELLRAIKLWEQLPAARLGRVPGLSETIQSAKVRVGHLAGRLYHQAREHAAMLANRVGLLPAAGEVQALIGEIEGALRYTQDLRDLLTYEQQKSESAAEVDVQESGSDLYRRMDTTLTTRREELHEALHWAQTRLAPHDEATTHDHGPLSALADTLQMTPAEISRALEVKGPLPVQAFERIQKPSRNNLYRITLEAGETHLPTHLIAKCFQEAQVTFFSACYRRERGVLELLREAQAPVPRLLGGHLGSRLGVLFMEDLGTHGLAQALQELPADDRGGRRALVRLGLETLVTMRVHALPALPKLEREIAKIVKEVLTPEYYCNTTTIALNRIVALDRRQLSSAERGRLEVALRPLVTLLMNEPRTFIHFEYTPGNLHLTEQRAVAVDFEQATMGPAAFDVATLLYSPEADLTAEEIEALLAFYHELLPASTPTALVVSPEALEAAAIMKLLFYAGSAANFYRKFEEGARLAAMEWYLRTADALLSRNPEYRELSTALRLCWRGQTHLPV